MTFHDYLVEAFFDEMFDGPSAPRAAARPLVQFIDALPKSAVGKILRRELRDLA